MNTYLYALKPKDDEDPLYGEHDVARGFVVRATSPAQARTLAAAACGDEGPDIWHDASRISCRRLSANANDPSAVILQDYHSA